MRNLYITTFVEKDNELVERTYLVDAENIRDIFGLLCNPKIGSASVILEEGIIEFLLTMINPDAYTDESHFNWNGNSFFRPIKACFR